MSGFIGLKKRIGRFRHNETQSCRQWRRHLEYLRVYGEALVSFAQDHTRTKIMAIFLRLDLGYL